METERSTPLRTRRLHKPFAIALAAVAVLAAATAGVVALANATDSPAFCGSACHEMGPFHEAWADGPHKGIACVDCHVDPTTVARLEHKLVALQQIKDHVTGATHFPLAKAPAVPDSRCLRCHASVKVKAAGFSHADHAKRGACVWCHATAGHDVTSIALKRAGILAVAYRHASVPTTTATPGGGKADLPSHIAVGCSKCHDMAAVRCASCHAPGPNHQGRPADCTICHSPGAKFVFTHPARTDCATCHTPPRILKPPHEWKGECTVCHVSGAGVDWKFTHPQDNSCGTCHTPPSTHTWSGVCTGCHKAGPGTSFAFTHPNRTNCEACHARPANHRSGDCAKCHQNPGVTWTFSHPSADANCASCHVRPSSHRSGLCQTCHKNTGQSWKFTHPSASARCTACHTPPANHFGTDCASCHTPGTRWAQTHVSHPAIPQSIHTYQTWPCAKCHPNGAPAYFCTCHGNTTGPSD